MCVETRIMDGLVKDVYDQEELKREINQLKEQMNEITKTLQLMQERRASTGTQPEVSRATSVHLIGATLHQQPDPNAQI